MRRVLALTLTIAFGLLALGPTAPARAEQATVLDDSWYAVYLGGNKSGWMHVEVSQTGLGNDARFETSSTTYLAIGRGSATIVIEQHSRTVEAADGRIISVEARTRMGETVTPMRLVVDGDSMTIVQGTEERVRPYPAGAIGPAAVTRLTALAIREAADGASKETVVQAFSSDTPEQAFPLTIRAAGPEEIDVGGVSRKLQRVAQVLDMSGAKIPTTSWIDAGADRMILVLAETKVPMLGTMRQVRTDQAFAQAKIEPGEFFVSSFIKADRALDDARTLKRATFRLRSTEKEWPLGELPAEVGQTVEVEDDGAFRVSIDTTVPEASRAATLPLDGLEDHADALRSNNYLELKDDLIVELSKKAVAGKATAFEAARAIEAFVRDYIDEKNFGVAFATAAETARTRQGDCTEHGVLCAALARAAGLPARVALGLVYIRGGLGADEDAFPHGFYGYHMWTEVWIGDRWMAIDAAIGSMDATHITLGRTNLNADSATRMTIELLSFMGNLSIEVVEPR